MVDRSVILNAFRPNSEIEDPSAFAGRRQEVRDLTDALMTHRSCPVIYGERGLGKTSLATQIARISLGDDELLARIGAKTHVLPDNQIYVPFFVSCSDETRNKNEILQRIINTAEGFDSLDGLQEKTEMGSTTRKKLNLKIFERETTKSFTNAEKKKFSRLNVEDRFHSVVKTIHDNGYPRLLFVIDELDRVSNTDGLANFIKNCSTEGVKFLLVGIANNISTLLSDHESVERNLCPIQVHPMTGNEMTEIVNSAVTLLNNQEIDVTIETQATGRLVSAAGGFPWFIHVLGQEALRAVWDSDRTTITVEDVEQAIITLAENRFAQQFSDAYQMAVRESRKRELVLRLMAKWPGNDVPVSEIYPAAKRLGVTNPSASKKDLMLRRHGSPILAPPAHERGQVRFRNAVFKRYINLRSSIYEGVRDEVDSEWEDRA